MAQTTGLRARDRLPQPPGPNDPADTEPCSRLCANTSPPHPRAIPTSPSAAWQNTRPGPPGMPRRRPRAPDDRGRIGDSHG